MGAFDTVCPLVYKLGATAPPAAPPPMMRRPLEKIWEMRNENP